MATVKDALNAIESHEKECRVLYKSIDKRLEDGSKRFGMETKLDTLDEKLNASMSNLEDRLGTKLDSQHGILVALIDRVRSLDNEIIRQDTMIKTILGVPQLINIDKIAKADRDDQRKD